MKILLVILFTIYFADNLFAKTSFTPTLFFNQNLNTVQKPASEKNKDTKKDIKKIDEKIKNGEAVYDDYIDRGKIYMENNQPSFAINVFFKGY